MKAILNFLKRWFEKNWLFKIIGTFIILAISITIVSRTQSSVLINIFTWVRIISIGYIIITFLVLFVFGLTYGIKDIIDKIKKK
jgi:hypothetical protein